MLASSKKSEIAALLAIFTFGLMVSGYAQSGGNSTSVTGTIKDPTGAVVTSFDAN